MHKENKPDDHSFVRQPNRPVSDARRKEQRIKYIQRKRRKKETKWMYNKQSRHMEARSNEERSHKNDKQGKKKQSKKGKERLNVCCPFSFIPSPSLLILWLTEEPQKYTQLLRRSTCLQGVLQTAPSSSIPPLLPFPSHQFVCQMRLSLDRPLNQPTDRIDRPPISLLGIHKKKTACWCLLTHVHSWSECVLCLSVCPWAVFPSHLLAHSPISSSMCAKKQKRTDKAMTSINSPRRRVTGQASSNCI
mmetsp:Transcript_13112/g.25748  ORF Transcript_13112/g.25748 Transcript_13112/m.25748 type:complete len:247 (-) Transcript_13112:1780-2520(-)